MAMETHATLRNDALGSPNSDRKIIRLYCTMGRKSRREPHCLPNQSLFLVASYGYHDELHDDVLCVLFGARIEKLRLVRR